MSAEEALLSLEYTVQPEASCAFLASGSEDSHCDFAAV